MTNHLIMSVRHFIERQPGLRSKTIPVGTVSVYIRRSLCGYDLEVTCPFDTPRTECWDILKPLLDAISCEHSLRMEFVNDPIIAGHLLLASHDWRMSGEYHLYGAPTFVNKRWRDRLKS